MDKVVWSVATTAALWGSIGRLSCPCHMAQGKSGVLWRQSLKERWKKKETGLRGRDRWLKKAREAASEGGRGKGRWRNRLCLLCVCSIFKKRWPHQIPISQSYSKDETITAGWRSVNMTRRYINPTFYKSKTLKSASDVRPAAAGCSLVSVGQQGHICWKMKGEAAGSVASTERWRGQDVAPAQTPDSLFKFKVTVNGVFIKSPPIPHPLKNCCF